MTDYVGFGMLTPVTIMTVDRFPPHNTGAMVREIKDFVFDDAAIIACCLRQWGVDILTVGQYLQPSKRHLPIERYYTLDEFKALKDFALNTLGFRWVECAPLVRSSYHADQQVKALSTVHRQLYG